MSNQHGSGAPARRSEEGSATAQGGDAADPVPNRGDRTARHGLSQGRIDDPAEVVKRARKVFERFRGWQVTIVSAEIMAGALWLEFPRLSREDAVKMAAPAVLMGKVLDEREITARANNVATAVIVGDLL